MKKLLLGFVSCLFVLNLYADSGDRSTEYIFNRVYDSTNSALKFKVGSDLEMGNTPYSIDGGTNGLAFDSMNSGTTDSAIIDGVFNAKFSVKLYGAKGDGVRLLDGAVSMGDATFTSATASFTSADVGKVITIINAGGATRDLTTTIASINSSTSVELTDVAVATVSGVPFCYGTDDTIAIQSAIDATAAKNFGTVYFPHGIYVVNGAFDGTTHSQIVLPEVIAANTNGTNIVFKGEIPNPSNSVGSIIYGTRNGATGADSIISGYNSTDANHLTQISVWFENLLFRTVQNPVNSCLNLQYVANASGYQVTCDTAGLSLTSTPALSAPTTAASTGLILPGTQNNGKIYWERIAISGFYTLAEMGEHARLDDFRGLFAINGLKFGNGGHLGLCGQINIEGVKYPIYVKTAGEGGVATSFIIQCLDIEHRGAANWYSTVYDVNDAGNLGFGEIGYQTVGASGGGSVFLSDTHTSNLVCKKYTSLAPLFVSSRIAGYLFERPFQTDDSFASAIRCLTTKNTDMADGFGSGLSFNIQDNAGVINAIGYLGAIRNGADNTGRLVFATYDAGSATVRLSLDATGLYTTGHLASTMSTKTLAGGVTTMAITSSVVKVTGDAGGNTLATITGGISGERLTLIFVDDKVTITDTDAATANTVNLSAAFTSTANDTMTLVFDGNKWFEVARSVN